MANFCEIYGYISYRGHAPDFQPLVDAILADSRIRVAFSVAQKSFTLGYVSFAGEAKLDEDEFPDWEMLIEKFIVSIPFVVCTFHIVPDESESRMYCYLSGERVSRSVTLASGQVQNKIL
jgi:hypothetical protein